MPGCPWVSPGLRAQLSHDSQSSSRVIPNKYLGVQQYLDVVTCLFTGQAPRVLSAMLMPSLFSLDLGGVLPFFPPTYFVAFFFNLHLL